MKKLEEAMEILEAYDATGSLRAAAALTGCDHKTVARLVAARDAAGAGRDGLCADGNSASRCGPRDPRFDYLALSHD